jgi:3-dehydroquinate dehydratase II
MKKTKNQFAVINGPNLNMLGRREPEIYGSETLDDIRRHTEEKLQIMAPELSLTWFQDNSEGELITILQKLDNYQGVIINPGGLSHTSVALLDALKMLKIPKIEAHLSQTHLREEFRHVRLTAKACEMIIEGLGRDVYWLAALALRAHIHRGNNVSNN